MTKTIMASLVVLVLVMGIGSVAFVHSAEARGMPTYWKNGDGTMKVQYFKDLSAPHIGHTDVFPITTGKTNHDMQIKNLVSVYGISFHKHNVK